MLTIPFRHYTILVFVLFAHNDLSSQTLFINEFMATNSKTILDKDYNSYSDWIEIYNAGSTSINLKNYFITDVLDQPKKYQFKNDLIINANGYIIIWADDANISNHTNFKLSASGESIGLFDPNGILIDSVTYGMLPLDISYGRFPNGANNWYQFSPASPLKENLESGIYNLLPSPVVSLNSGFYNSSINVSSSHSINDVKIRYTTDGSIPGSKSNEFPASLKIDSTTVIRFRAFKDGYTPSKEETRTYFINEKTELPVFSLVTDPANLFSDDKGIYVVGTNGITGHCSTGPRNWNQEWERPINLEFYEKDRTKGFKINAGVQIYGGCTRLYDQKSLAIYLRGEYGIDKLRYNLFDDMPINEFNNFLLRSSGQDWWRTMFRDGMVQTLVEQRMNVDDVNYRPSILFINGKYWGIHNIREKLNEHYTYYHHGADKDNIDLIEISKNAIANNGDAIAYNEMINFLSTKNMNDPVNYDYIKSIVDIDEYLDYNILQIYGANGDWPGSNMKLWRERKPSGKWRWMLYDTDFTFGGNAQGMAETNTLAQATATNGPAWPNPPWSTLMLRSLLSNTEFKNEFVQRFAAHMNTTFETNYVLAVIDSMAKDIASEIPRHKARWAKSISFGTGWQNQIDMMRNFAINRPQNMRAHIYAKFGITTSNSLNISRNNPAWGKVFANSVEMKMNDYRYIFFKQIPIRFKAMPLPGYKFVRWEGVSKSITQEINITLEENTTLTAVFEKAELTNKSIVINEINYKSSPAFDTEDWIELYNPDDKTVSLSNWKLKDGNSNQFSFSGNVQIKPNSYLIVCRDTSKFKNLRPFIKNITGNINFGLSSEGEKISLINNFGIIIDEVSYASNGAWSSLPNGNGPTLSLINPQFDNSLASNWKASKMHGTPSTINDIYTKVEESLNELPYEHSLSQNYPNPFNPSTTINFRIPKSSHVTLKVFDLLGREIATLVNEYLNAGDFSFSFEDVNNNLTSNVYFYQLRCGNFVETKKMILLK